MRGVFVFLAGRLSVAHNRKPKHRAPSMSGDNRNTGFPPCPPEAYEYDDDVTPAAVEQLRQKAAATMSTRRWTVVDGYVGQDKIHHPVG
jgi:hypothetical protein